MLLINDKSGERVASFISSYQVHKYKDGTEKVINHFGDWQLPKNLDVNPVIERFIKYPSYNVGKDEFLLARTEEIDGENVIKILDIEKYGKYNLMFGGIV